MGSACELLQQGIEEENKVQWYVWLSADLQKSQDLQWRPAGTTQPPYFRNEGPEQIRW
jgi:hypothetical protein